MPLFPIFRHAWAAILVVAFLWPAPGSGQDEVSDQNAVSETRTLCAGIRNDIHGLQDRMPFWIDSVTILIGMKVFYYDETCRLILEYLMDDTRLIEAMRDEWMKFDSDIKTIEGMTAFLNSEEGHSLLREELRAFLGGNPIFSVLLQNPGFRIGAIYRFLDDHINLIQVELGAGTNDRS